MDLTKIEYLGLDRVIKRGSAKTVAETDGALLVRDSISGAYMLACDEKAAGEALLGRHVGGDCALLMVPDLALGRAAFEKYGFAGKLECYQAAYFGERPAAHAKLTVREANESDLAMLAENYRLISEDELEAVVARRSVLIGYDGERPVGFIGEHLEGSMGLLYVFPEHRRRGYGEELQKRMIARTMDRGFIPFGQVEKDNQSSLALQRKLGMTLGDGLIVWMWK